MIEFDVSDYYKMHNIVLLLAFILGACGGVKVKSNKTKEVDLKKYKTYAWVMPGDPDRDPNAKNRKEDKKCMED